MTQSPFAGNDRPNPPRPPGPGGYGNPAQQPERQSQTGPGVGGQYSGSPTGGPGQHGGPGHYRQQQGQPGQGQPGQGQPGQGPAGRAAESAAVATSGGLQSALAAVVGLLGVAGFVLGFFQALSVMDPGGEIDAGKIFYVQASVPILLLAGGLAAFGTLLRSTAAAAAWLVSAALSLATGLGAGAVIYLYSTGTFTSAASDLAPEYKIQIGLYASAGVGVLMFILGLVGYLAAAKSASAVMSGAVARAAREAAGQAIDRAVSAATEAAAVAATSVARTTANATVNERLADLQRAQESARRSVPSSSTGPDYFSQQRDAQSTPSRPPALGADPASLTASASTATPGAAAAGSVSEVAPTEVTRSPFAHRSTSDPGHRADLTSPASPSAASAPPSAAMTEQPSPQEPAPAAAIPKDQPAAPPAEEAPDSATSSADSEVTQMTRLPQVEQLWAGSGAVSGGVPERASSRVSAPVDTPRWQPSDRQSEGEPASASQASAAQPLQMDEPTMRYRAMPQAEPESYVWPIQQQPIAVDPLDQTPTYTENPDLPDHSSDQADQSNESSDHGDGGETLGQERPTHPRQGPAPSEWNLQPPQYPPAPQDSARYAAAWDDTQETRSSHPEEGQQYPWPSIPRAE